MGQNLFLLPPPTGETGGDYRFALCLSLRLSVCPSVCPSHSFSGLFFAMLSHIWMKVCSKLLYEELQIKFHFRQGWPTFSWVIALCSKFVFRTFLHFALNESWLEASIWRVTDQDPLSSRLTHFFMSYCPLFKIRFPDFSSLCFHISEWKLVGSFHMKSYRSSSTFVTVDLLFHELLPFVYLQFVFQTFLGYDFTFLNESWYQAILTIIYWKVHQNNGCWFKFVWAGGRHVLL